MTPVTPSLSGLRNEGTCEPSLVFYLPVSPIPNRFRIESFPPEGWLALPHLASDIVAALVFLAMVDETPGWMVKGSDEHEVIAETTQNIFDFRHVVKVAHFHFWVRDRRRVNRHVTGVDGSCSCLMVITGVSLKKGVHYMTPFSRGHGDSRSTVSCWLDGNQKENLGSPKKEEPARSLALSCPRPSSLQKRLPSALRMMPPTPRRASRFGFHARSKIPRVGASHLKSRPFLFRPLNKNLESPRPLEKEGHNPFMLGNDPIVQGSWRLQEEKNPSYAPKQAEVEHGPGLGRQELDLGIRIIRLDEAGGVHLDPLQVDALRTNGLAEQCISKNCRRPSHLLDWASNYATKQTQPRPS